MLGERIRLKRDFMYKCLKCGKDVELKQVKEKIRCPYCGFRVVMKKRPKTLIKVGTD